MRTASNWPPDALWSTAQELMTAVRDHKEFLFVFITQIQYLCFKWRHNGHTLAPPLSAEQLPTSWHVQTTNSCTFRCELQFHTDDVVVVFRMVLRIYFFLFPLQHHHQTLSPTPCVLSIPECWCNQLLLQLRGEQGQLPGGRGQQPHAGRLHTDLLNPYWLVPRHCSFICPFLL